ncbi:MAG: ABC transporter substrate-binding protein [Acidimicrobiia bacterium]|nr:ABC transporter substrate-binding protein [Acidimicrobiia bacterium]
MTSAASSSTSAGSTASTSETTTATAAGDQPGSLEEWEARWREERAAIVARIEENGWGKSADGTTLTGPEGWTVDLTACPKNWSDTEGVTDSVIKIGQTMPLSGTYADVGNAGRAIGFLFDYYSDQGLFEDTTSGTVRRIEHIVKDDAYDPARAIPNVDELLDHEKTFLVWTQGTPSTLKTYDKLNERCVPQPMALTAHVAWGDPVNHPWTTGIPQPTYSTEAVVWGAFLEQHLHEFPADRKVKVASLVQSNDFGALYDASFEAYIAQSPELRDRVEYVSETIEASAPTVVDPMTTLAAEKPDMWITMLAGTQCTQIVTEAARNGLNETAKYLFMPQSCPGATYVGKDAVGGDGSVSDGWYLVSPGLKDLADPSFHDDPYVDWLRGALQAEGIDPDVSTYTSSGINYAFPVVQALAIAGQLEGGVTRTNFQLALRSMDMTSPMLLPGIRLHMNGLADAYIVEGGSIQRWDAATQTYVNESGIIDLDGKAELCAWDQATSTCA